MRVESSKKDGWKKLVIAEKALNLVSDAYRLVKLLPEDEKYGLASQIKRCVISIPANIGEGHSRGHTKEFIQFLYIAKGSAAELDVYLDLLLRLDFADETNVKNVVQTNDEIQRMLSKMITSLQTKVRSKDLSLNSQLSTLNSQLSTLIKKEPHARHL